MTIAEWCLFSAVLLYLLTLAPTKALAPQEFDNANPRDQGFYNHPIRKMALGAHINGIETFPFFAAAVLLAEFRHAPQHWIDGLALAFLLTRIAFVVAYIANRPTLRTVLWNVAMAFNVGIFFLSGFGVNGALIATFVGLGFALALWPLLSIGSARLGRNN
ncbi:MAG: MAPEG family protein [Sphingomicrobium sp.]